MSNPLASKTTPPLQPSLLSASSGEICWFPSQRHLAQWHRPRPFPVPSRGDDFDATANNLADFWKVEYPHPVDHAMIEIVLATIAMQKNSWFLREREH